MEVNMKPVEIKFSSSDVPKLYDTPDTSSLGFRDVIAYIRGKVERNPWVPVILNSKEKPFAVPDLEGMRIYWKGVNDDKVEDLVSISRETYCVIAAEELDIEQEDCGLEAIVDKFQQEYGITANSSLIVGKDDNDGPVTRLLVKLRRYVIENERMGVEFPKFIVIRNKLLPNGVDIAPYAEQLASSTRHTDLTSDALNGVLDKLSGLMEPFVTIVQDLKEYRTTAVKMLTTYLILKYNLPPVYVNVFLAEYVAYEFFYPFRSLSLYERVNYLYRMPNIVGYIGRNYGFNCLAQVNGRIFPSPHYVFNLSDMCLEEDVSDFALDSMGMRFADYRTFFKESKSPFVTVERNGLAVANTSDREADKRLTELFSRLSDLVSEEPTFLSVKNTIFAQKNGKKYVLYCPEECGIEVTFMSEYFGTLRHVVTEKDFCRIIDAQIEWAVLEKFRNSNATEGSKAMALKLSKLDLSKCLKPAIPLEIVMHMKLIPFYQSNLSYYDKMLRCCDDVLPIITSTDSDMCDVSPIFNQVSLYSLREDPQAREVITCFGTLSTSPRQVSILPITYKAFNAGGLL